MFEEINYSSFYDLYDVNAVQQLVERYLVSSLEELKIKAIKHAAISNS